MDSTRQETQTLQPRRRALNVVAGVLLVLVILGLLAALWMPALVGARPAEDERPAQPR